MLSSSSPCYPVFVTKGGEVGRMRLVFSIAIQVLVVVIGHSEGTREKGVGLVKILTIT